MGSIKTRVLKLLVVLVTIISTGQAFAQAEPFPVDPAAQDSTDAQRSWADRFRRGLDNEWYKVSLDMRARSGFADIDGQRNAYAYTLRSRFGVGSKPWKGLSAFVEGQATYTPAHSKYFDGTGDNKNNRSIIADVPAIRLNRAFIRYQNPELLGANVIGGRQRIILDDARFVGNVGWRQNEQTYDAARGSTSLGLDGLEASYSYLWHINRISSDQGKKSTRDWDSRSHLMNVSYEAFPWLKATGFAYLLDFRNDSSENSSNSYGLRLSGSHTFREVWETGYSGSFAWQTEAKKNSTHYEARYGWIEGSIGHVDWLTVGTGFENLGSDDGTARFVTPLATAHKFNGFADAFLDNGGVDGLRDYFLWFSPKLPWGINAKAIYHRFWTAEQRRHVGDEFDLVASRKFGERSLALVKGAVFDGQGSSGRADRWRLTFELNFKY